MAPLHRLPLDDWFDDKKAHPYDSWPVATDKTPTERLHDDMRKELGYENPRPEEEIADAYASRHESTPDFEKGAEEIVTMHEKMYRMARAKYNPFAVGGSENVHG